jgi:hypothetical protein
VVQAERVAKSEEYAKLRAELEAENQAMRSELEKAAAAAQQHRDKELQEQLAEVRTHPTAT